MEGLLECRVNPSQRVLCTRPSGFICTLGQPNGHVQSLCSVDHGAYRSLQVACHSDSSSDGSKMALSQKIQSKSLGNGVDPRDINWKLMAPDALRLRAMIHMILAYRAGPKTYDYQSTAIDSSWPFGQDFRFQLGRTTIARTGHRLASDRPLPATYNWSLIKWLDRDMRTI